MADSDLLAPVDKIAAASMDDEFARLAIALYKAFEDGNIIVTHTFSGEPTTYLYKDESGRSFQMTASASVLPRSKNVKLVINPLQEHRKNALKDGNTIEIWYGQEAGSSIVATIHVSQPTYSTEPRREAGPGDLKLARAILNEGNIVERPQRDTQDYMEEFEEFKRFNPNTKLLQK